MPLVIESAAVNVSSTIPSFRKKKMLAAFALAFLAAISAYADPNPTNPGPGNVFIEGQACSITWTPDTTGVWKTMTIELRTGDNFNMINLACASTQPAMIC